MSGTWYESTAPVQRDPGCHRPAPSIALGRQLTFPFHFNLFGYSLPAHAVLEVTAYAVGFQCFLLARRRDTRVRLAPEQVMWLIAGAVFGALIGSKVLAWLESPRQYWEARHNLQAFLGGKTIVGGLLGGWLGVEVAKRLLGIRGSSGDAYVWGLIPGIAIGRVGCFLTGLDDHTHGTPTALPWGVDFGDGLPRHPTQLYEIAFVLLWGAALRTLSRRSAVLPDRPGALFRLFLLGYLLFRLAVDFIKPVDYSYAGLTAIQWAALLGALVCLWQLVRWRTA